MNPLRVGVVGPCTAGKSTLIAGLEGRGFTARHIAQEHSYVPDMWQRITQPDVLIYLHVAYPQTLVRRKTDWTEAEYNVQLERLAHARRNADLVIDTTGLSIPEVLEKAAGFLTNLSPGNTAARSQDSPQNPRPAE
jgi:hypothetical protein